MRLGSAKKGTAQRRPPEFGGGIGRDRDEGKEELRRRSGDASKQLLWQPIGNSPIQRKERHMGVTGIKKGGRRRELLANIHYEGTGALVVCTEMSATDIGAVGMWGPIFEDRSLCVCKAVPRSDGDNSLSEEYPYAVEDGDDVVLINAWSVLPRAFESLGIKPQKWLVTVFEHLDWMADTVGWDQRRALGRASM
ncbi:MAG: hypothetical protein HYU54_05810 [Actinobacteria bacterium]|nr:hypothetical protein [Actinomycetota bacterium]